MEAIENEYEQKLNDYDQKLYEFLFNNPEAILYLKNRFQTDRVWKFCIERDSSLFGKMENPSPEMCEYALDVDGENIIPLRTKFLDVKLTKRMAYLSLKSYPGAIRYIPDDMLTEDMLNMAFDAQPSLISGYPKLSDEYLIRRIQEHPSDIRYVVDPSEEVACIALEKDPNLCVYFNYLTPQMINIIRDLKPDLAELYTNTLESETICDAENSETERAEGDDQWTDSYQLRRVNAECSD